MLKNGVPEEAPRMTPKMAPKMAPRMAPRMPHRARVRQIALKPSAHTANSVQIGFWVVTWTCQTERTHSK